MIFIVVKFKTKPEYADRWLDITRSFTQKTREEPGNLWFEWSRSVDDPNEYVLVEAFEDDGATAHVESDHFKEALKNMRPALAETPRIISRQIAGSAWDEMGELMLE